MRRELFYWGFWIYHDGTEWVAEEADTQDLILEIGSQSLDRIVEMIDELRFAMEAAGQGKGDTIPMPGWFREWNEDGCHARVRGDVPVIPAIVPATPAVQPVSAFAQARELFFSTHFDGMADRIDEIQKVLRDRWRNQEIRWNKETGRIVQRKADELASDIVIVMPDSTEWQVEIKKTRGTF